MYESPIKVDFTEPVIEKLKDEADQYIVRVCQKMKVDVDREELIRALQYDRDQYLKGYMNAMEELSKRVRELEYDPTCDPEWRDSPKGRQEDTLDW